MLELTIDNNVYSFRFGMGFFRDINKRHKVTENGVSSDAGLQYYIAGVYSGDVEMLVDMLDIANKTETLRVTRKQLDSYIDDENTDIDALFDDVLGFLQTSNATKKVAVPFVEALNKEMEKRKAD